jgi:putative acyl-CoA dehydrogenase
MGLDVLRAFARDGEAAGAVLGELAQEAADLPGAAEAASLIARVVASDAAEIHARLAVERLAQLAAAVALKASAPAGIAASFARTRLAGRAAASFGTSALDAATMSSLLELALPPG